MLSGGVSLLHRIKAFIKRNAKKMVFGAQVSPDSFLKYLREQGVVIGEGTCFLDPVNTIVDTQNPKLLIIGKNVRITSGVKLLTHDFSWSVIGGRYGECIGAIGSIEIGDNVFVGVNTVVLRNTVIGSNVIIGAGSVVAGVLEGGCVYAGNPAKKIMTLEEFYEKRKNRRPSEIACVLSKINRADKDEVWRYLREYSCYFKDAPADLKKQIMADSGYLAECEAFYSEHVPVCELKEFIGCEEEGK